VRSAPRNRRRPWAGDEVAGDRRPRRPGHRRPDGLAAVGTIGAPVSRMTAVMRRLASGDNSVEVPAVGRKDEVGQMADAVLSFKDAAIAKAAAGGRDGRAAPPDRGRTRPARGREGRRGPGRRVGHRRPGPGARPSGQRRPDPPHHRRLRPQDPPAEDRLQRRRRPAAGRPARHQHRRRRHPLRLRGDRPGLGRPVAPHRTAGRQPGRDRRGPRRDHRHGPQDRRRRQRGLRPGRQRPRGGREVRPASSTRRSAP
jgi:HAMP domain-containing protein